MVLKHPGGYTTFYGYNENNLGPAGDQVAADQVIARVGSTGRATGPHPHFEVRLHGQAVDPGPYLNLAVGRKTSGEVTG